MLTVAVDRFRYLLGNATRMAPLAFQLQLIKTMLKIASYCHNAYIVAIDIQMTFINVYI
jgi:hypothetical protein